MIHNAQISHYWPWPFSHNHYSNYFECIWLQFYFFEYYLNREKHWLERFLKKKTHCNPSWKMTDICLQYMLKYHLSTHEVYKKIFIYPGIACDISWLKFRSKKSVLTRQRSEYLIIKLSVLSPMNVSIYLSHSSKKKSKAHENLPRSNLFAFKKWNFLPISIVFSFFC